MSNFLNETRFKFYRPFEVVICIYNDADSGDLNKYQESLLVMMSNITLLLKEEAGMSYFLVQEIFIKLSKEVLVLVN